LEKIDIYRCDAIEEVVSNRDDEYEQVATSSQTDTTFLPRFDYLYLSDLPHLKLIDGTVKCSRVGFASPSLCQSSRKIQINKCETLASLVPFSAVGKLQKLEELKISSCRSLKEIFEIKRVNKNGSDILPGVTIPRSANMTLLELPNLKILRIINCDLLEHIFTSSTLDSLKQLIELTVEECNAMQVIVKEDGHHTSKTVLFPRLKSLTLTDLPNVEGFFLGMNEFRWSILDEVKIYGCPKMMTFTSGRSMTPKLLYIHTGIGKHSLGCGLNFPLSNASHEEVQFHSSSMCSNPNIIKLLQYPWSFSNLFEVNLELCENLLKSGIIFRCNELINLQNLEKLHIRRKYWQSSFEEVKEIFEVVNLENDDVNEKQSVVVFPKLKEVTLGELVGMRYIWKSSRWITLNFPSLTQVLIDRCPLLEHVFTCCMVRSLLQLRELDIRRCDNMEVIVKKAEDSDTRATDVVVFRSLKSVKLDFLPNLKGFCLGMEDFLWQSLDTLEIKDCPQITVFTCGQSTTPQLKEKNAYDGNGSGNSKNRFEVLNEETIEDSNELRILKDRMDDQEMNTEEVMEEVNDMAQTMANENVIGLSRNIFINVANTCKERNGLWKEICRAQRLTSGFPWLLVGDFNVTLKTMEHSVGGSTVTNDMHDFIDCVNFNEMREKLKTAQNLVDANTHSAELKSNEVEALRRYNEVMDDEEKLLFQKDKVDWMSKGDMNNKYFHKVLKSRSHYNKIVSIYDEEGTNLEGELMENQFVKHFQKFLGVSNSNANWKGCLAKD
ncbi:NB-ARC domains-containing protein, partial [Tanacetum coccineum]